jgi:hypothetical protein
MVMNIEDELRDAFADALRDVAPKPEPYQRLLGRRRRRREIRVFAAQRAGVVVLVVLVIGAGWVFIGPHRAPSPAVTRQPKPALSIAPNHFLNGITWAGATDADHLYATARRCPPTAGCGLALYGSDDAGRTWTRRGSAGPAYLTVAPGGGLVGWFGDGQSLVAERDLRVSTDGGRSWAKITTVTKPVAAVPAGGYAMCPEVYGGSMTCTVYAVDLVGHRAAPLANQPPLGIGLSSDILPMSIGAPGGSGALWAIGTPRGKQQGIAVAVSRDAGRTWHTKTVDPGCAANLSVLPWRSAAGSAAVHCTPSTLGATRLYGTTDYGASWQRVPVPTPLPFEKAGDQSDIEFAADGSLVGWDSPKDGSAYQWWVLPPGGGSWRQVPTGALPAGYFITVASGGGFLGYSFRDPTFDLYRSTPDLTGWTKLTIPVK